MSHRPRLMGPMLAGRRARFANRAGNGNRPPGSRDGFSSAGYRVADSSLMDTESGPHVRHRSPYGDPDFRVRHFPRLVTDLPRSGGSDASANGLPLQGSTFVLTKSPPHPSILTGVECPTEALIGHRAPPANSLRIVNLTFRRTGRTDREEELRIFVTAERSVAPVHAHYSLSRLGPHCS